MITGGTMMAGGMMNTGGQITKYDGGAGGAAGTIFRDGGVGGNGGVVGRDGGDGRAPHRSGGRRWPAGHCRRHDLPGSGEQRRIDRRLERRRSVHPLGQWPRRRVVRQPRQQPSGKMFPDPTTGFVPSDSGDACRKFAAYTYGSGYVLWGANLWVGLGGPYNASNYNGISFWAKIDTGTSAVVRVAFPDKDTQPDGNVCQTSVSSGRPRATTTTVIAKP
jgi:hypothetical protein